MQLPYKKRSAFSLAVLVTALAAFVGASVGSAAPTAKVPIPPDPLKKVEAQVNGLKIKGGFPNNPRDQKLHQLALAEGGQVNVYSSLSSFITKPVTFSGLVDAMNVLGRYWLEIVELPPNGDGHKQ